MKGGNLFASLAKGTLRNRPKPQLLTIPLQGETEGGKEMAKNLKAQEQILSTKLPRIPESSTAHPDHDNTNGAPTWGIGSLESVRASIGFVEEHLNSLIWIQQCLITHHKSLVRTRLFTETFLDSVSKAMYVQNRFKNMQEVMTRNGEEDE